MVISSLESRRALNRRKAAWIALSLMGDELPAPLRHHRGSPPPLFSANPAFRDPVEVSPSPIEFGKTSGRQARRVEITLRNRAAGSLSVCPSRDKFLPIGRGMAGAACPRAQACAPVVSLRSTTATQWRFPARSIPLSGQTFQRCASRFLERFSDTRLLVGSAVRTDGRGFWSAQRTRRRTIRVQGVCKPL